MSDEMLRRECWCYTAAKQVWIRGRIVGHRQADVMRILDCEDQKCTLRNTKDCLVGKVREAAW